MSLLSRGGFIEGSAAAGASAAVSPGRGVELRIRWYGAGVYELATPDDKKIVLVDAWIWNNTGFTAFGIEKPPELARSSTYVQYIKNRKPDFVVVALTHDHSDHMDDYVELLKALTGAGIDVKTVGQYDLMRIEVRPKFRAADLNPATLILNAGSGINFGGGVPYKGVHFALVPAVHSTMAAFPAAGLIIDIGGTRVYASGDTDLFGDLALIGRRYKPALAVLSAGNGAFTMGPEDAASAVRMLDVPHAIPVHYGFNPSVIGPRCGAYFRDAVARVAPRTAVTVLTPGKPVTLMLPAVTSPRRGVPIPLEMPPG